MLKFIKSIVKRPLLAFSIKFNLLIASIIGWMEHTWRAKSRIVCNDAMTSFGLTAGDRILVLAPHPDDESAGMGVRSVNFRKAVLKLSLRF